MRSLQKRLTVVNRGNQITNEKAITKVLMRYVDKMVSKGWCVYRVATGDSFLKYEAIVTMYKS